ncbi:auxin transporter-like protein 3 [Selaginella moellendorffii]|uniref:auxin transporter-like protein 3 n=1 Tax=Selaginella moellendorffii TaxID=88036 RepID=UPI000D1C49C1|nr:auxin transporter-like protein 3 [Selaginella moellendorffii]|eukprot:XP_024516081.1 auxin transporter-like protein 3 [Selaginella moellendorffii]
MGSRHPWHDFLLRVLWHGGSTFDAWLNISSVKMASRLLTMPQSTAQMGLPSAIAYQLFQGGMGAWVQHVIGILFLKYRLHHQSGASDRTRFTTTTQLHEVIGGHLGPRWRAVSFVLNIVCVFYVCSLQLVACSNIVYNLNRTLDKRTWTSVFTAVFSLTIFIPNAHNYRIWSFLGVITTTYVAAYLVVATLAHEKVAGVKYTTPHSYEEYFTGLSGLTILGHVVVPVEIMDAMWKPQEFSMANAYSVIYILLVTMIPSISMNRRFGDILLKHPNALSLLPSSKFRDTAIILLLVHLFINFGMYSLAVYAMWEKLLRVHDSPSYGKKILSRVPVFLAFWLTALAFPFFGIISKILDATFIIWNFYVIPCAAYNLVFWSRTVQQQSKSLSTFGWVTDFSLNLGVILWVVIVECGLALWGDMVSLLSLKDDLRLFAKCYNC